MSFDNNGNPSDNGNGRGNPNMGSGIRTTVSEGGNSVRVSIPTETTGGSPFGGNGFADSNVHVGGLYDGRSASEMGGLNAPAEPIRASSGSPSPLGGGSFTARTEDGFAVSDATALKPNDIVNIPGVGETTFEVALMTGLLTRDANGNVRGLNGQEQQQVQQREEQQQQDEAQQQQQGERSSLDPASEALMEGVFANDAGVALDAMRDLVGGETGEVSDGVIEALATANGWEPAQARQNVEQAKAAYAAEAYAVAAKQAGTDVAIATEALMAAGAERSTGIQNAMSQHFETGKADGYAPFVTDYIANLDATPEGRARLLSGTFPPGSPFSLHAEGDTVIVTLEGGTQMKFSDAVLQRRINVYSR